MDLPTALNILAYITSGNQDFTRTSTWVVELAEILAECLHPRWFDLEQ